MSLLHFFHSFYTKLPLLKSVCRPAFFKSFGIGALALVLTLGLYTENVSAKRVGGGRSVGRSSHSMPHRASPAHAAKPVQSPAKSQPHAQASGRNRWLGPIAGLAAGLGIAALLSHLGLGGAMGGMLSNLLVIAGIMLLAYWGIRLLAKRRVPTVKGALGSERQEPFNAAPLTSNATSSLAKEAQSVFSRDTPPVPFATPSYPIEGRQSEIDTISNKETVDLATSTADISTGFDGPAFLRYAKVQFIRMQDSWDKGNLEDIGEFTTPEMFAEIKIDLSERKGTNQTHVEKLDAQLLSMHTENGWQWASVQFSGLIQEAPEQETAQPFSEIWNFSKYIETSEVSANTPKWMLAGIEQNENESY